MEKTNFWKDAAFYGVIMALVAFVFDTLNFYTRHAIISLVSLLLFLGLLTFFTKQRVARYGANGYSYGQCLRFILAVMLCAGFLDGAYMSVAANWLFASKYEAMMAPQIELLESTGFYTDDQILLVSRMLYSPLALIFSAIVGALIKGGFFGLFISAYARREAPVFAPANDSRSGDGDSDTDTDTDTDTTKNA